MPNATMITTPKRHQWLALTAMSMGVFMGLLDVTVVNVALPTMVNDFNTNFTNLQWVLNAYTLVYAVSLLIMSKLGDMYGRKKVFLGSLILFVLASAVNGMASSLIVLDIGRGIQAIGGAGMNSLSMALVASNFSGNKRGVALGILGSVIGMSTASGPLIGGFLVENFGWPSIFYVNVPVGIVAVIMTLTFVNETPSYGQHEHIDFAGMLFSGLGLFSLIYGLIIKEGHPHWSWMDVRIGGWIIAGFILIALFIWTESRVQQPMMSLNFFKQRHFVGTIFVAFALGASLYSFNTFLTALMQNYIGYSALQTGVRQLTISGWSLVLGPISGYLGTRFSKKRMISASLLVGACGFLVMLNAMGPRVSFMDLMPGMLMIGFTNGIVSPLINTVGMEGVAPQQMGMASGLLNIFRQLGIVIGVVGFGLMQATQYENYLNTHIHTVGMPSQMTTGIHAALIKAGPFSGHTIAWSKRLTETPFAQKLQSVVVHAYDNGMAAVLIAALVVILIGSLAAAVLMRKESHADVHA